jgi:hypothetical protein
MLPAGIAQARFAASAIKLPSIEAKSFKLTDSSPQAGSVSLFIPASNSDFDLAVKRQMDAVHSNYLNGITAAIKTAFDLWRTQAFFKDIKITGPTASGGSLEGPDLTPLILSFAPVQSPLHVTCSTGIASAIGAAWMKTQRSVRVPGLPWYPSFAAFPGPMAPPTPNIPSPFIALSQDQSATMVASLANPKGNKRKNNLDFSPEIFASVAVWFSSAIQMWKAAQMVTNVLGKGPVPTFAPPYVPVGPVVLGDNIPTPGHLMT